LRQSLESGRLVVIDAYADESRRLGPAALARQRALLPKLVAEAREELTSARGFLEPGGEPSEAAWAGVESATNRVLELEAALAHGRDLRRASGRMVPSRGAERTDLSVPDAPPAELARAIDSAQAAQQAYATGLAQRYGYNLLTHNCVTEIFRTI